MDRLKELIDQERRRNPKEFIDAERKGELLYYLENALKKANINPALLNQYCKERPNDTDLGNQIETFVETASGLLDDVLFEPYYASQASPNNLGIADVMAAFRASGGTYKPLKQLKVGCALTSILCLGLSVRYGMSRYIPHSFVFLAMAADLLRVSYNCYDKKYCSLYLHMIGGSVSKLTDTIFKFAKSVVGMAEPSDDPLLRLRSEIVWANVLQDTLLQQLYFKVRYSTGRYDGSLLMVIVWV
jgi:hypothetical protein